MASLEFLQSLKDRTIELQDSSEELLRGIATGQIEPDDPSWLLVAGSLGWDERRRKQEIVRMGNVVRYERDAVGDQEFANLIERADGIRAANGSAREKLLEKVRKLEAEIAALDRSERDAEKAVSSAETARSRLRELCPSFVESAVNKELGRLHAGEQNQRRLLVESQIRFHESVANREVNDDMIVHVCENRFPHAISRNSYGHKVVEYHAWDAVVAEAGEVLKGLRDEYAELDRAIREEEEAILQGLNYYVAD